MKALGVTDDGGPAGRLACDLDRVLDRFTELTSITLVRSPCGSNSANFSHNAMYGS